MNAPTLPLNPIAARAAPAPRVAGSVLPPLPRAGSGDVLTPGQRRVMIAAIVAAHAAGAWGLMQISAVREAVLETAPLFVDLIAPPMPPAPPAPPPPPTPQPIVRKPPPPVPVIAAAPSPAPSTFVVAEPKPEPVVIAAPPAPPIVVAAPVPPAPPPAPKNLSASAVQYASTVEPEYPRLSRRNAEAGRVTVRVFIDEAGTPRQVQVGKSSGFERLDASALAAVLRFRFKPPTENGQPVSGWANVPIDFGLER
jgi:protein TonB